MPRNYLSFGVVRVPARPCGGGDVIRFAQQIGFAALSLLLSSAQVAQAQLAQRATQTLDQAVSEFQAGRLAEVLRLTQGVLESTPAEQLQLADQRLQQWHGLDMTVLELATRARVELVLDGQGGHLGRPGSIELAAALVALDDRMSQLLEPVRGEAEI